MKTSLDIQYTLNKQQRIVLVITAVSMIVMLLFPPFHIMSGGHEVMAVGYHFGLQLENSFGGYENFSVDRELLRIQLIVTFLVGVIGLLLFHARKAPQST